MKDRIREIMETQHMTQQVFADFIGLAPATLSSIFNGRTRPTLNVVEQIKKKIPNISTDWLLFGAGKMFEEPGAEGSAESTPKDSENRQVIQPSFFDQDLTPSPTPPQNTPVDRYNNGVRNTRLELPREEVKIVDKPQRRVIEIRVFYDDQTWDTFIPAKK